MIQRRCPSRESWGKMKRVVRVERERQQMQGDGGPEAVGVVGDDAAQVPHVEEEEAKDEGALAPLGGLAEEGADVLQEEALGEASDRQASQPCAAGRVTIRGVDGEGGLERGIPGRVKQTPGEPEGDDGGEEGVAEEQGGVEEDLFVSGTSRGDDGARDPAAGQEGMGKGFRVVEDAGDVGSGVLGHRSVISRPEPNDGAEGEEEEGEAEGLEHLGPQPAHDAEEEPGAEIGREGYQEEHGRQGADVVGRAGAEHTADGCEDGGAEEHEAPGGEGHAFERLPQDHAVVGDGEAEEPARFLPPEEAHAGDSGVGHDEHGEEEEEQQVDEPLGEQGAEEGDAMDELEPAPDQDVGGSGVEGEEAADGEKHEPVPPELSRSGVEKGLPVSLSEDAGGSGSGERHGGSVLSGAGVAKTPGP
jgi:hypothetical protein